MDWLTLSACLLSAFIVGMGVGARLGRIIDRKREVARLKSVRQSFVERLRQFKLKEPSQELDERIQKAIDEERSMDKKPEWYRLNEEVFSRAKVGEVCPCPEGCREGKLYENCCRDWWEKLKASEEEEEFFSMPASWKRVES